MMIRKFNVAGICVPDRHYMVDISEKIEKIFEVVLSVGKPPRRIRNK